MFCGTLCIHGATTTNIGLCSRCIRERDWCKWLSDSVRKVIQLVLVNPRKEASVNLRATAGVDDTLSLVLQLASLTVM